MTYTTGGEQAISARPSEPKRRIKREDRLGFRIDDQTKALIERAAQLERRKVSDFCVKALIEAARETVSRYDMLHLTEAEREVFFDVLTNPQKPNARLERAVAEARRRVAA